MIELPLAGIRRFRVDLNGRIVSVVPDMEHLPWSPLCLVVYITNPLSDGTHILVATLMEMVGCTRLGGGSAPLTQIYQSPKFRFDPCGKGILMSYRDWQSLMTCEKVILFNELIEKGWDPPQAIDWAVELLAKRELYISLSLSEESLSTLVVDSEGTYPYLRALSQLRVGLLADINLLINKYPKCSD